MQSTPTWVLFTFYNIRQKNYTLSWPFYRSTSISFTCTRSWSFKNLHHPLVRFLSWITPPLNLNTPLTSSILYLGFRTGIEIPYRSALASSRSKIAGWPEEVRQEIPRPWPLHLITGTTTDWDKQNDTVKILGKQIFAMQYNCITITYRNVLHCNLQDWGLHTHNTRVFNVTWRDCHPIGD